MTVLRMQRVSAGRATRLVCVGVGLLLATSVVAGCAPSQSPQQPTRLAPSEVREYQGKRLDSVDDFRENSIKGPQSVDIERYRLRVLGEVDDPLELTYDEVLDRESFEKVVRLNCVEGWSVDILWEGVLLRDVLEQAGYDPAARVVIFRCEDGYSTSLPLDFVVDNDILLAYKMNDVDLPEERGYPFQVVAEDKWGYKWAKWVTSIEVSNDESFRGYWEQRGYDNDADFPSAE
jgi:DMSO/TMAO reductase YedYZ molybdopterin-dependent catalytic subunit